MALSFLLHGLLGFILGSYVGSLVQKKQVSRGQGLAIVLGGILLGSFCLRLLGLGM